MKKYLKKINYIVCAIAFLLLAVNVPIVHADSNENVLIRSGDTIVFQGPVALSPSGTISVPDATGTIHSVQARSVLGLLYTLSQTSHAFTLSDLEYYPSFNSFYLKCLSASSIGSSCDNWQYVVNGVAPSSGLDTTLLSGGENLGLYFGSIHRLILDTNSIDAGQSFTAKAQTYQYLDNTWSSLSGVSIGITIPNPNDQYNPTVIDSHSVGPDGSYTFTLFNSGTYTVGIVEDYYFPSYTVTANSFTSSKSSSGSMSGNTRDTKTSIKSDPISYTSILPHIPFDSDKAVKYIESVEDIDGSFGGSDLYTDWASIGLASANISDTIRTHILDYMSSHNKVSSLLTDNERHSMALLALGENPYSFHGVNYIAPIVASFDGTQFGDSALINDDIFALITLNNAGYNVDDTLIFKDVSYIISRQESDGSWGESIDLTSAAVQALKSAISVPGVSTSLINADGYIKNQQDDDGGWGPSVYTTSWALQAMYDQNALWINNGHKGIDYLASAQSTDGSVAPSTDTLQNKIWSTSYAIPAALGKSWNMILHPVSKQVNLLNPSTFISVPDTNQDKKSESSPQTSSVHSSASVINSHTDKVNTQSITKATSPLVPKDVSESKSKSLMHSVSSVIGNVFIFIRNLVHS